ncbi:MAG: EAL domain-containing protein [Pseudomonadota bacterium]
MLSEDIKILLVEDSQADAKLVELMLAEDMHRHHFNVTHAERVADALKHLAAQRFDAVLLDLSLPDGLGLDPVRELQSMAPWLPIVVLSGYGDEALALQAVQCGAQDYLIKGQVDARLLARALRYAIERKRAEEHLNFLANHDALTHLPNRVLFLDRLGQALVRGPWHKRLVAILFLDLDRFKHINDTLGHNVGDLLLKAVGERLQTYVREGDTVARLGGDEFAVILADIARAADVARIAQKITRGLTQPFKLDGHELSITPSIGISLYPSDATDAPTLLKNADTAMYRAKERGGGYQLYSSNMNAKAEQRLDLENSLRGAVESEEFLLYYQPQIDLHGGHIFGVEALLRWQHPQRGLVAAREFIGAAEETGLIVLMGLWALQRACAQLRAWHDAGLSGISMSVNLTARQFRQHNLLHALDQILNETGIDARHLELELTESLLAGAEAGKLLAALKERGFSLSIDDFGTGYSCLSNLRRFPIDRLKIDHTLMHDVPGDADHVAIVTAIIALAHSLKLKVIAEGVETLEQLEFLRSLKCNEIQGYLLSTPLSAPEIEKLLTQKASLLPIRSKNPKAKPVLSAAKEREDAKITK